MRIACAECHHHPFDRWGQDDYHGMPAFFTGVRLETSRCVEALAVSGDASARTRAAARRPRARPGREDAGEARAGRPREELAEWMTDAKNPYFARNLANRVWAHFLGRGLVEPVDDVRDTNPPSNPELLDALAKELIKQKYDVKALIRAITASRTYQLSTKPNEHEREGHQQPLARLLRRVPAEVLLDMVSQTTGVPERFRGAPAGTRAIQLWDSKVPHYFLKAFGRPERTQRLRVRARTREPSVAQVLHLLNAPEIEAKLTHAAGRWRSW